MISVHTHALLFDMDGVLIDSTPAVTRVWTEWALRHGFDPVEVAHRAQGRPSIATIRELLPNSDHAAENLKVERSEMEDLDDVAPLPGAVELLSHLPSNRWAIVTSSTRALAEVRMRAAGLPRPSVFITANDIVHGKPHPEPYLKAAESLGFLPIRCVVVEDAPPGIRAGKSAGSRVIAFPTTMPESRLQEASPDWIVANCASILLRSIDSQIRLGLRE